MRGWEHTRRGAGERKCHQLQFLYTFAWGWLWGKDLGCHSCVNLLRLWEGDDNYKSKPGRSEKVETDYGKLGASFLHIVNRLDLEIKQYFRKLQEMKTETKCHCEIFTLVSNDGIRQKCLCSYLNPERLRTFYSSIF